MSTTLTSFAKCDKFDKNDWNLDTWGMKNKYAGINESTCLEQRRDDLNKYCGVSDIKMHFVPRM